MLSINQTLARMRRSSTTQVPISRASTANSEKSSAWRWLVQKLPFLHAFNFILIHYLYMIVMTIIASIMLYPAGNLDYIDALFFAAGSCTQSGLNTIDINKLNTYQQIVLILFASLCNPITINTTIVFIRLYWFEKRFRHIVSEARRWRASRMTARTQSMEVQKDPERGVDGREIKVLHPDGKLASKTIDNGHLDHPGNGAALGEKSGDPPGTPDVAIFQRKGIIFADELGPERNKGTEEDIPNSDRLPQSRPTEQHIAFVENQRKAKTALHIPGPRDVERGERPQPINDEEDVGPRDEARRRSFQSEQSDFDEMDKRRSPPEEQNAGDAGPSVGIRSRLTNHLHVPNLRGRKSNLGFGVKNRAQSFQSFVSRTLTQHQNEEDPMPYLSYNTTIGRNSQFVDLTEEQREELGGIEYRSLKTLAWVLLCYNIGWTVFGIVIWTPWILHSAWKSVVTDISQSPTWWGIFTPMSHFTDLGFTLTPDSMISFQTATMPLITGSFLIIIGNTGFPCMLRFCIWLGSIFAPNGSGVWEEFRFLLDHPRRCFTLLFPRRATWWLFIVLIVLNGIDLIFFVILDLNDPTVTHLKPAYQFLDGLYQAAATRTAGFAVVNLAELHPAIQVSYLVMMYISVLPIAISVRQTNVYEEKSLGIYHSAAEKAAAEADQDDPQVRSYLGSHLRRQLSFDLWYVFLGLFLICIVEGSRIESVKEPDFTIWSILFEIVSAYGTVGLSLGFPGTNASFSGQFKVLSKLIVIAMMLRGRHRGLPYALDRAILLPGEGLKSDKVRRRSDAGKKRPTGLLDEAKREIDESNKRVGKGKVNFARIVAGVLSAGPVGHPKMKTKEG